MRYTRGMRMDEQPLAGLYRHFKGNLYEVLATATDAESEAPLVVYRPVGSDRLWVRTQANFFEVVERDGRRFPRFERVQETGSV